MPLPAFDVVVVGGINSDFVLRGPRLPEPGETQVLDQFFQGPGGKGANQAVAAARLGARVAIIGAVGRDSRGDDLLANLQAENVDTRFVARVKAQTGVALILVNHSGEKLIGASLGANSHLAPSHVRAARAVLSRSKVLLMQFEAPNPALLAAAKIAKKSGAKIILDPAPPREIPASLLPLLDVLRPNAAEAAFLSGVAVKNRADARRAAQFLLRRGVGAVALQAGAGGDLFLWAGGEVYLHHFKVKSVDATGAGDAFAATLAVGLAEGHSFAAAGRMASAAAAIKTTRLGAQAGLPTRRALDRFLRAHPTKD